MVIAYMFNKGKATEACSKLAKTISGNCTGMRYASCMCM
jgi:hypothetical protein